MPGGAVPDFERDEATISAYESAKLRYIRAITQDAEAKLREAFGKRREAINDEIANLRGLAKSRSEAADRAAQKYAAKLPHRVRKTGVPGSIVLGTADGRSTPSTNIIGPRKRRPKSSKRSTSAAQAPRPARCNGARDAPFDLSAPKKRFVRSLQTPEGLAALHADPMVKAAFSKMQGVMNERAKYDERVKRGEVPPEEARDREMAQRGTEIATVPLEGVRFRGSRGYATVEYYVLRDLSNHEYLLSCDPALEPLRDVVFDISRSAAGYEASLRHTPDGSPMRVLDHLKRVSRATMRPISTRGTGPRCGPIVRRKRPSRATKVKPRLIAMLRD